MFSRLKNPTPKSCYANIAWFTEYYMLFYAVNYGAFHSKICVDVGYIFILRITYDHDNDTMFKTLNMVCSLFYSKACQARLLFLAARVDIT